MTLDRSWEKFKGGPEQQRKAGALRVTINRTGMIYMNAKIYQVFGKPQAVALYYNRAEDSIAVEPSNPRHVENFPVAKNQLGWSIHASTFCRHFGIKIPNTECFIRPDITNEGQLVLKLRETVMVGGIERKRSQKV